MVQKLHTTSRSIAVEGSSFKLIGATVVDERGVKHKTAQCKHCDKWFIAKGMEYFHNYGGSKKKCCACDGCYNLLISQIGDHRISRNSRDIISYHCSNFRRTPREIFINN